MKTTRLPPSGGQDGRVGLEGSPNPGRPAAEDAPKRVLDSPFQVAPDGHLFSVREAALGTYDRPGLDGQTPLDVQLKRLGSIETGEGQARPEGLLDSVRNHPARNGPIGKDLPSVAAMWPALDRRGLVKAQANVEAQMRSFFVQRTDGTGRMSLLDKLMDPALPLSPRQRNRIKQTFGEYWNSLQNLRPFDTKASDENWNHICHEAAQVIDASMARGATADGLEDALLASMFSDAVKFQSTLLNHNIHGAIAADIVLSRRKDPDMPPERVAGIVQATKEHQVGVPGLFAKLAPMFIGFAFNCFPGMDRKDHFTAIEIRALDRIERKLSDPLSPEHTAVDPKTGARAIVFDADELTLLSKIGVSEWPVPDPNTPWFDATLTVIYADSVQYGMPDGVGKIQLLSGPGTNFTDDTVLHSAFSCGISYLDCLPLVPDELRPMYEASAVRTKDVLRTVTQAVDDELAAGGLIFDAKQLERIVDGYNVDMGSFETVPLDDGRVRVGSPYDDNRAVPYFHVPLDYAPQATGLNEHKLLTHEYSKLVRSRVADAMRSAAEWYQ